MAVRVVTATASTAAQALKALDASSFVDVFEDVTKRSSHTQLGQKEGRENMFSRAKISFVHTVVERFDLIGDIWLNFTIIQRHEKPQNNATKITKFCILLALSKTMINQIMGLHNLHCKQYH